MKEYISIPDWDKLQHYKDRTPPWIKLHNELLESYEFECLPDASKAHLLCIWLLASRTNNKINPDPRWIGRKIGANSEVNIKLLIDSGFLQLNQPLQSVEQSASSTLQSVEQPACLEREREERESRVRVEEESSVEPCSAKAKPNRGNRSPEIVEVFEHWQTVWDHPQSKLDDKRKKFIRDALKLGYTVGQLKTAIDGCRSTPHNSGQNDRGQVYDGIHIIFKSADQIDRFIRNSSGPVVPEMSKHGMATRAAADQVMSEMFPEECGNGY